MITIKDIAKVAGVSHTTVSRALRGDPRITNDTTERILQLADELGYIPNSIAQSLNAQRTYTIGMLVTSVADPVVMDFVEGAEEVAQERGYCIFLSTSRNDPVRELHVVEMFQRRRVDGVIVVASRSGDQYQLALDRIQVPLVLLDSEEVHDSHPAVNVDNVGGAAAAVAHLLQLGHRRIGYIGATDRRLTNRKRLAGYTTTLQAAGIQVDPTWVINPAAADDIQRGRRGLDHCLAAGVTAIFCYNDQIAISVLNSCYHKGIAVPQQLSIVGFDDIRPASYVNPPLTTVRQPLQQMGRTGMAMVLALIDKTPVQNKMLDCTLVVRASTGVAPGGPNQSLHA
ncbi:MAG: LacI family transcriptional regulator [Caldilinea sp. CFX5]|nr:LacI family transcriptional regulator [Caldilinea sp. CFX5]